MNDKHDPNGVPIGTFAASDDGEFEIPIEIVNDDEIEPRTLAIQANSDDPGRFSDEQTPVEAPRRKRVQTLLGVALPGLPGAASQNALPTLPAAHDPTRATRSEISRAVDDALDEQPTMVYGQGPKRESGGLRALDTMLASRFGGDPNPRNERVDAPSDPGEIVGLVGQPTDTGTYQIELFDIDIDEARKTTPSPERKPAPAPGIVSLAVAPPPSVVIAPPVVEMRAVPEPQPVAAAAPEPAARMETQPRPVAKIDSKQASKEAAPVANAPRRQKSEPAPKVSSLAPKEISRPAAPRRKESNAVTGLALIAAMVLLGIGGFWLTSGGYQRTADPTSQPSAAASIDKPAMERDSVAAPKLEPVAPAEPAATEASAAAPAEQVAPAPVPAPPQPIAATGTGSGKPRVAVKKVRGAAPAPVADTGPIETPTRSDVLTGLDGVRSSVQACAEGRTGVAEVDLTIAANGIVTNALVGGDFGGTAQGSCIARAVRKARFPQFKQDRYRVLFPYVL